MDEGAVELTRMLRFDAKVHKGFDLVGHFSYGVLEPPLVVWVFNGQHLATPGVASFLIRIEWVSSPKLEEKVSHP